METIMLSNESKIAEVEVISRDSIPAICSVVKDGQEYCIGELRDFLWHDLLKKFLPAELGLSFSWVRLRYGETLLPHVHPVESMIIITKGRGQLTGQKNKLLNEGDIVAVPPGCAHGFECVDEQGFHALSVQFEQGLYTNPEKARVEFKA